MWYLKTSTFNMIVCPFKAKFDAMKKQLEAQEMEVMEARLMKTSELNGEMDDDDDDAG